MDVIMSPFPCGERQNQSRVVIDTGELGPSITDCRGIIKQREALGVMTRVLIFEVFQWHPYSPRVAYPFCFLPYI